ncbi:MAG: nucleotidyl transferase AbiEii/AbiGii toxin family protein [Candidatus Thermoplasmatota archaeon]
MIPQNELKIAANRNGVPLTTIERDYVQGWILQFLPQALFLLKGGTAIRKAYIPEYRYSDDMDFTVTAHTDAEGIRRVLVDAIARAGDASGIRFSDEIRLQDGENGFVGAIHFRLHRAKGSPVRIKLDMTKAENEPVALPVKSMPLNHPYSDARGFRLSVYSPEEIFSEKVRSLFQRTRPRDLYDVDCLAGKIETKGLGDLAREKCRIKGVSIDLGDLEQRKADFEMAWRASLEHQIAPLPDFRTIFERVMGIIRMYEGDGGSA